MARLRFICILLGALAFGLGGNAAATSCAHVLTGVNRTSVSRGQSITISAALKNCSGSWETATVVFTLTYIAQDGTTRTSTVLSSTVGVGAQNLHTATYSYTVPTRRYPDTMYSGQTRRFLAYCCPVTQLR
jgi:hypothetical protein